MDTPKTFKFTEEQRIQFSQKAIEEWLGAINRSSGGETYVVDLCRQKIITNAPKSRVLCGFSKATLNRDGLEFFKRVMAIEDVIWLQKVYEQADNLFRKTPKSQRPKLEIFYDLPVKRKYGDEVMVHHKVKPFQFCEDGSLWLALCFGTLSPSKQAKNAYFVNYASNKAFVFDGNRFVPIKNFGITGEEEQMLILMLSDMSNEEMAEQLRMIPATFNSKKKRLITKLNANSAEGAIHQAHLLGVF